MTYSEFRQFQTKTAFILYNVGEKNLSNQNNFTKPHEYIQSSKTDDANNSHKLSELLPEAIKSIGTTTTKSHRQLELIP